MDQRLLLMHQAMLADSTRIRAYDRAMERTVGPGDVVADVGAGTLVLSALALRHGAEHVYAIEADPQMVAVAAQIAAANDLKDRLTLIQGDARVVRLPRKADVVVAELMGNLGPEEEMAELLSAVARRNLAPGGRVVPRGLTTRFAAIEFVDEGWGLWSGDSLGLRMDPVQQVAEPTAQLHFFQREPTLLSKPAPLTGATAIRLPIVRAGRLHAVIGYFTADLANDVSLSNFPSYPGCNWAVWVWPLRHTTVRVGDALRVKVIRPRRTRMAEDWRLECGIARQEDP